MKKIISSMLAVVVILACFSLTTFAADTNLYFNDGATTIEADADTIDLTLYLNKSDEEILEYGYDMLQLNYTISGATMEGTALKTATDFDGSNSVSSSVLLYTAKSAFYRPAAAEDALATFSLTRDGDAESATITFTNVILKDTVTPYPYACTYPATVTINWPGSEPEENVAEFVKDTVELTVEGETHSFTDVPVYEGTTSATSFKLKAVYGEESNYLKFNDSETIDVSNIKVDGEGTVTFQVAIIGKPAAVTIDKLVIE